MSKKKILVGKILKLTEFHAKVAVTLNNFHPLYRKYVKKLRKYRVKLDMSRSYKVGDTVNFEYCRPLSKTVFCRVV